MSTRLSAFAALNKSDSESEDEKQGSENNGKEQIPEWEQRQGSSTLRTGSVSAANSFLNYKNEMAIDLGLSANMVHDYSMYNDEQPIIILSSNFGLTSNENTFHYDSYQLVGLQATDVLVLKGQYTLTVLHGSVEIESYRMTAGNGPLNVNASNINSLPSIRPISVSQSPEIIAPFAIPFQTIIKITNMVDNLPSIPNLYPHLRNLYNSDNTKNTATSKSFPYTFTNLSEPETNKVSTCVPSSWKACLDHLKHRLLNDGQKSKSVLIIGNKNSGKSTFMKNLLNTLLSSNSTYKLQVLDIDPGQPELCLPGCISLTQLVDPLVGTVESFRVNKISEVVEYLGFNSPVIQPLNYLNKLNRLLDVVNSQHRNTITLINCPGWVKGFGVEIISHLSSSINLSYLIQLSDNLRDLDILKDVSWDKQTEIIKIHSITKSSVFSSLYSPSVIRTFKLLTYMHYNAASQNYDFSPLLFTSPYRISYLPQTNKIDKMLDFNGIVGVSIFDSCGLLMQDTPNSLECQYMALVTVTNDALTKYDNSNVQNSSNFPHVIDESFIHQQQLKFYGLCLIHSVNTEKKTVNLYTPIDVANLRNNLLSDNEKLILVKGREDLPLEEMYSTSILKGPAQYWTSFGLDCLPYVSSSLSNDAIGGKTVGIRRNIQRR